MKRILVGVDDSPGARAALAWAIAEARQWGATLEALMAWSVLVQPVAEFQPDFSEDDAAAALDRILADHDTSGIEVVRTLVNDLPARALLRLAPTADLVVVGARGLGGFTGLLLGSVSQHVATHAPVPVVVVRPSSD